VDLIPAVARDDRIAVVHEPAAVVPTELHAGPQRGHGRVRLDRVDAVEHRVRVEDDAGVGARRDRRGRAVPTLRVEGERAAVAVVEPADGGRNRHAILVEEPRVVHDDHEPLRVELPVRATELRHVGVHGELLPRDEEVRVHDRRLDDRPAVNRARRLEEALVAQEGLDAVDAHLVAVGVALAEVVGACAERRDRVVPAEAPAGL